MTPAALRRRIDSWPRVLFAVMAGALALVVCALFFPPRTEIWARRDPHLQEWSRADAFLKQCQDPYRQDVEPAVRWRLIPPLVCHTLGLTGYEPLFFCSAGLAVFAVVLAARLDQLVGNRPWALLGTLGFATSGPFITALGWLGLNDGWYLLALLETVAIRSLWALAAWALVGPWIDERFLIALPLALYVRARLKTPESGSALRAGLAACAGIAPYVLLRIGYSLTHGDAVSSGYLAAMLDVFRLYASYVPLGWLMGYRVGWLVVGAGLLAMGASGKSRLPGIALGAAALGIISVVAWDLDRSTGVLLPIYVAGVVAIAKSGARPGGPGPTRLMAIGVACLLLNLVLPYAHVVGFTASWNRGPLGLWRSLLNH
jgi:hypothetical protein